MSNLIEHLNEVEKVVDDWPEWKAKSCRDALVGRSDRLPQLEVLNDIDIPPNTIILGDK